MKEECRLKDELIKEKNELLAVKDREIKKKNKRITMMLVAASTDSKKKNKAAGRWAGKRLTGDEDGNQVILQNNHRNFIWSQCKHLPRGWWVASEKKGTICSIAMEGLVLPAGMTKKSYWDTKVASCFSFIHSTRMSRVRDLMKKEMHREYIIDFFLFRCATALTFVNVFVIDKEILDRKKLEGLISPERMLKFVDLEENPTENMVMDISNFHLAFTVLNYDRKHIEGMLEDEDENGQAEDSLLDILTVHDEAFAALQYVDLHEAWTAEWNNRHDLTWTKKKTEMLRKWKMVHRGNYMHQVPDEALAFYNKAVRAFQKFRDNEECEKQAEDWYRQWWKVHGPKREKSVSANKRKMGREKRSDGEEAPVLDVFANYGGQGGLEELDARNDEELDARNDEGGLKELDRMYDDKGKEICTQAV